MSSFCKHLNSTKDVQSFISWVTILLYNYLETLLNTPITDNPRREKARLRLLKHTNNSVDKLLELANKHMLVDFIGESTKPIYKPANARVTDILELLDAELPEIYNSVGFIEQSSRLIKKIADKSKPKKEEPVDDIYDFATYSIKNKVIDY